MSDAPPPPPIGGNHLPPGPPFSGAQQLTGSGGYDLGEAFGWAWRTFTNHAGFVVVGVLIIGVVNLVLSGIGYGITVAVFGFDQGLTTRADGTLDFDAGSYFGSLGLQSATGLVVGLPLSLLYVGYLRGLLDLAAGRRPTIGQIFRPEHAGTAMLAWFVVSVVTPLGYVLLIVPGIVWQVFTLFVLYFVAAGPTSATGAIGSSLRLVRDNAGSVFVLAIISFLLVVVGVCACGVGLLVALPIVLLLQTYAFCVLQGRTVAG